MRSVENRIRVKRAVEHISAVLRGVLFIGVSIQTVTGIIWMCCNLPYVPQFGDSLFYMRISRTLRCDEYTGILYPVFLWAVRRNHYLVYVIQLAAAYIAARCFLRSFLSVKKWMEAWGCLAVITPPVVMQCHMAMLPCSFAASLLLLQLSLLTGAIKKKDRRTLRGLAGVSLCWLALALLLPEYLYLGAVPVALFGVCCCRQWRRDKRIRWQGLLLAAAFGGMILGINSLTQTPGLYGRPHKTLLMTLTQRISWISIIWEIESWPDQLIDTVERGVILETAQYADGMDRIFFPAMEQAVADQAITQQQAEEYYCLIMKSAWEGYRPRILKGIAWDVLGYAAPPAVLQAFLAGRGYDSYSGRNYDFFLEHTPGLSRLYMDYGSWCFALAAALAAALQVLALWDGSAEERKTGAKQALCCLTAAGAIILWYTMQGAGMQDYKNTALTTQLWQAWAVMLLWRKGAWRRLTENEEDVQGER